MCVVWLEGEKGEVGRWGGRLARSEPDDVCVCPSHETRGENVCPVRDGRPHTQKYREQQHLKKGIDSQDIDSF